MLFETALQTVEYFVASVFINRDVDAALSCFTDEAMCFGVSNIEFARGRDEIRNSIMRDTLTIPQNCKFEFTNIENPSQNDSCETFRCRVIINELDSGVSFSLRLAATCVKVGGSFLICSLHMAFPKENPRKTSERPVAVGDDELDRYNNAFFDTSLLTGWIRCKANEDFTITYINDFFVKLLGYESREELMQACGGNYTALMEPGANSDEIHAATLALPAEGNIVYTYCLTSKQGRRIWIREHCHKYTDDAGKPMLLCMCANVTDIVRLEDMLNRQGLMLDAANAELKSNEEMSRIREEETRLAILQTGKLLFLYTIAARTVEISPEAAHLFDYKSTIIENVPESIMGSRRISDEMRVVSLDFYERINRGEKSGKATIRRAVATGSNRWYSIEFNTVFDNEGKPFAAVVSFNDITSEREEYIDNELDHARLLTAIAAAYPIALSLDYTHGKYKVLSGDSRLVSEDMLRGNIADLFSADIWKLAHSIDPEIINCLSPEAVIKQFAAGNNSVHYESSVSLTSGETHWVEFSIYKTENPHNDDVVGVALIRFIDEQKNAELKLKEALESTTGELTKEREYQQLLDSSIPMCVVICKLQGENSLLHVGGTLLDDLGYTNEEFFEIHRNHLQGFIYEDDYMPTMGRMMEIASALQPEYEQEFRVNKKGGGIAWVYEKGRLIYVEGNEPAYISSYINITQRKLIRDELRISTEETRLSMAQPGKLACIYDIASHTVTMPKEYAAKYGLPMVVENIPDCNEALGLMPREYCEGHRAFFEDIIAGRKTGSYEYYIRCEDNTWRWEKIESVTIFDMNDKPVKAVVYVEDTTERHHADNEASLLRELIGDSLYYYRINLTKQVVDEYRGAGTNAPLITDPVPISEDFRSNLLVDVLPEYKDAVRDTLFAPALERQYKEGKNTVSLVYRQYFRDKGTRWLRGTGTIASKPGSAETIAIVYCVDIDEEHKNALALESALNEELESVSIINLKSGQMRFAKCTSTAAKFIAKGSMSYDSLVTRVINLFVAPDDRSACLAFFPTAKLMTLLKTESSVSITYKLINSSGKLCRETARAFYLDETHEDLVVSRMDVTNVYNEEQLKNQLLQDAVDTANAASRAKSEFISRMSHDMRTPLNAIISLSGDDMTAGTNDKQKADFLDKIHSSGNYLLGIINDVLDMSRIESKKMVLRPEPYSLVEFMDTINTVIGEQCRRKGINFAVTIPDDPREWVMLDKVHTNQIFLNLLTNAVKFTPADGRIDFSIEHLDVTDTHIVDLFIVRDTGIGMSKDFLPHAFESFSQERRIGKSENNQGTGLGLAIVKQIVDLMGGSITVFSEPGQGTSFRVKLTLPIAQAPHLARNEDDDAQSFKGRVILLCEDHPLNAEIAAALLEKKGCKVEVAENGQIGLDLFQRSDPGYYSLVLMDIRMPVMDGLEATRAIRASRHPDSQRIPIVALTADAFSKDALISREAGMNGHLSKPIEPKLFYEIVSKQISKYEHE